MKEVKTYWDKEETKLKEWYFLKVTRYHGLYQTWYESGQKSYSGNYVNGEADGLHERWYENGNKWEEAHWLNGELHGPYQEWHLWTTTRSCFPKWYLHGTECSEDQFETTWLETREW
jgi:antitoxin component YwqK of YwqJK toxin-antitoxin module